jgi:MFS family permease
VREVATTLTDFVLALLSLACAVGLFRRNPATAGIGARWFFVGFGLATLCGGFWHGYFSAPGAAGERLVWWSSMLFGGLGSIALGVAGVELTLRRRLRHTAAVVGILLLAFGTYAWSYPNFLVTLIASAGGTLVCGIGLVTHVRFQPWPSLLAIAGLLLAIAAGLAQQSKLALHPLHFDHNATYHLLLIPALVLFYAGFRGITLRR